MQPNRDHTLNRREVLTAAIAFAGFRNDTLRRVASLLRDAPDPNDDRFWEELRGRFSLSDEFLCFNNAGLSPSPSVVQSTLRAEQARADGNPSMVVYRRQSREVDKVRERLSKLIGCASSELALVPNATYGLHTAIMGVQVPPGKQIVVTTHEYARTKAAVIQRKTREGVAWSELPVSEDRAEMARALPTDLALGVFSSITYLNGSVLPVPQLCERVKALGGLSLIDGAQSIGILPQDVQQMGCDMYAACLHKWIMGPIGTGIFYVRHDKIPDIFALHPCEPGSERTIQKFEHFGTRPHAPVLAVDEALDFHEMLGQENKLNRIRALRKVLAEGLQDSPNIKLYGNPNEAGTDIVLTVGIAGMKGSALALQLQNEARIHVSPVSKAGIEGVRLSPTIFTTQSECTTVCQAISAIAKGSGALNTSTNL